MIGVMTPVELADIEARLYAIREVAGEPWRGWLASDGGLGGDPFISFSGHDPNDDDELYLSLHLKGTAVNPPDPRLDTLVDFLAHAPGDIDQLIDEVRRLAP